MSLSLPQLPLTHPPTHPPTHEFAQPLLLLTSTLLPRRGLIALLPFFGGSDRRICILSSCLLLGDFMGAVGSFEYFLVMSFIYFFNCYSLLRLLFLLSPFLFFRLLINNYNNIRFIILFTMSFPLLDLNYRPFLIRIRHKHQFLRNSFLYRLNVYFNWGKMLTKSYPLNGGTKQSKRDWCGTGCGECLGILSLNHPITKFMVKFL